MLAERALSQDARPGPMGAARPVDRGPRDGVSEETRPALVLTSRLSPRWPWALPPPTPAAHCLDSGDGSDVVSQNDSQSLYLLPQHPSPCVWMVLLKVEGRSSEVPAECPNVPGGPVHPMATRQRHCSSGGSTCAGTPRLFPQGVGSARPQVTVWPPAAV